MYNSKGPAGKAMKSKGKALKSKGFKKETAPFTKNDGMDKIKSKKK